VVALTTRELQDYQAVAPCGYMIVPVASRTALVDPGSTPNLGECEAAVMSAIHVAGRSEAAGNLPEAINAFHRALQLDQTNRLALIGFARLKHRLGDLDGAIVTYRQSLKHHPNDAVALNDLAICYSRLGQFDAAEASLRTALNLEPTSRRYLNNLATVMVEQSRDRDALLLLTSEYGEPLANYNMACIQLRRAASTAAAGYLRASLELDPSFQPAADLLSRLGSAGHEIPRNPAGDFQPAEAAFPARPDEAAVPAAPEPISLSLHRPAGISWGDGPIQSGQSR
jgi:Tfp pilus assembly protein PilF